MKIYKIISIIFVIILTNNAFGQFIDVQTKIDLRQIREKYGKDATIEFAGWDVPSDVEDGIGLENYKRDK